MSEHICAESDCRRVVTDEAKLLNVKFGITDPKVMVCKHCLAIALKMQRARHIEATTESSKREAKEYAEKKAGNRPKPTPLPDGYVTRTKVIGVLGVSTEAFKKHILENGYVTVETFKDDGQLPSVGISVDDVMEFIGKIEELEHTHQWSNKELDRLPLQLSIKLRKNLELIRKRIENGALD